MKSILDTCTPRADILSGSFNPEIFTANLNEVIEFYQNQSVEIETIYTDAMEFFREATYPTSSLRQLLGDVFGRLSGDNARPALHRLETAFGGGKTHALIACTHIGYRGKELAPVTSNLVDNSILPEPGEISVVGIRGDEIPVHEPRGTELVPYTLWGEIAYQIGGETLYQTVEAEASSYAAPGNPYFEKVLGGRKALILLDELAQYAARLEAARTDGGTQLAAFLFSLNGYARRHSGIAVVVTLAGRTDAFATETERLSSLLSDVRGEEIDDDTAMSLGQKAVDQVESVAFRDTAPGLIPVQAAELSQVLAQRLLESVDREQARITADEYAEMYEKNARLLPDVAVRGDYIERMVTTYPFHPTLIDYLNNKLSIAENFQGTRGVLRVLALAMRSIWQKKKSVPMIHACHLDLRDSATASELLGRTGSSDLLTVVNADLGGPDTEQLQARRSNAEEADIQNPHPLGYPMYENTWKTVFLHSIVGREKGLSSQIFGLTEPDALFSTSFPGLTPPQIKKALDKIEELEGGAFYLRHREGRYYASIEPSVRVALSRIWHSLKSQEGRIQEVLNATARKVVSPDIRAFHVEHDVYAPEHIPDDKTKPVLGLVSLHADDINVKTFMTTKGPNNQPRERQNLVFLLVPNTVRANGGQDQDMFAKQETEEALDKIKDIARWALAIRELKKRPQDHGINPARLDEDDFRRRATERGKALETSVTEAYNTLWYPSASGRIMKKEIKTAGGESGASVVQRIRKVLLDENELITREHTGQSALMNFKQLFFRQSDTPTLEELRNNFLCKRNWPVLESLDVFEQIIRSGVTKGVWCVFRMGGEDSVKPEEFYTRENDLPLGIDLKEPDYHIITPKEAKKRRWTEKDKPDTRQIVQWVKEEITKNKAVSVRDLNENVKEKHGQVDDQDLSTAVTQLVRDEGLIAYQGKQEQQEKPDLISGAKATFYTPDQDDTVLVKSEAAKRGWLVEEPETFTLSGSEGARKLVAILTRIGSLYNRGASTKIDDLDLIGLDLPKGGTLRLSLRNVPPESMRLLGELFEVLDGVVEIGKNTEGYLEIHDPSGDCIFMQDLMSDQDDDK